jgi:hypothetical protein
LISKYPLNISAVKNGMENWWSSKTAHVVVGGGERERLSGSALARQVDGAWGFPLLATTFSRLDALGFISLEICGKSSHRYHQSVCMT